MRIQPWLRDYDRLQYLAVILIYIQIGCALIGSLGALYNGVLLINLAIALFALVAIESSSQSLRRTYAVLLFCTIPLDVSWFILFSYEIWTISSTDYGIYYIFSVKLTLAMQIVGCCVKLSSSFLWIQMYRLGASYVDTRGETDFDLRNSLLNPVTPAVVTQCSGSDDASGGSIYQNETQETCNITVDNSSSGISVVEKYNSELINGSKSVLQSETNLHQKPSFATMLPTQGPSLLKKSSEIPNSRIGSAKCEPLTAKSSSFVCRKNHDSQFSSTAAPSAPNIPGEVPNFDVLTRKSHPGGKDPHSTLSTSFSAASSPTITSSSASPSSLPTSSSTTLISSSATSFSRPLTSSKATIDANQAVSSTSLSSASASLASASHASFTDMATSAFNVALDAQPEQPSAARVLFSAPLSTSGSTTGGKNESLDVAVTQEDEMDKEAPETIGSIPNTTALKPNPFGDPFGKAAANPASSLFTMTTPSGELFRPASFSFQLSQPTNCGAFSGGFGTGTTVQSPTQTGFGQPAQIGGGQQALKILGAFEQPRQLGAGIPGSGFASASGFGGGFSGTNLTGGFSSAATRGGFAGLASTSGGFAGLASAGGGFAGAASAGAANGFGGGFAGTNLIGDFSSTVRGGFADLASTSGGFAGLASAGEGFAGAASAGAASGFGGGFGGTNLTGNFSSTVRGGFAGVASTSAGFAGFASAGGGFAGAASAGGGFAAAASAGGGFAGASSGGGFPAAGGGFGAFSNQQGTGGFSAFGASARGTEKPSEFFTQMRK